MINPLLLLLAACQQNETTNHIDTERASDDAKVCLSYDTDTQPWIAPYDTTPDHNIDDQEIDAWAQTLEYESLTVPYGFIDSFTQDPDVRHSIICDWFRRGMAIDEFVYKYFLPELTRTEPLADDERMQFAAESRAVGLDLKSEVHRRNSDYLDSFAQSVAGDIMLNQNQMSSFYYVNTIFSHGVVVILNEANLELLLSYTARESKLGASGLSFEKEPNSYAVVQSHPDTVAYEQNEFIPVGSVITQVDGVDVYDMNFFQMRNMLRGPYHCEVTLTVVLPDDPDQKPRDVTLKREYVPGYDSWIHESLIR